MDKGKVVMIVIIGLLVVLLGIIGVVGFKLVSSMSGENAAAAEAAPEEVVLSPSEITVVPVTDPIATNLKEGADGVAHSVRVTVAIGVDTREDNAKESAELVTLLTEKEVIVKDTCLTVIRDKTYEELKQNDAKTVLSEEILVSLQEAFDTNLIYAVYISDIYVQ